MLERDSLRLFVWKISRSFVVFLFFPFLRLVRVNRYVQKTDKGKNTSALIPFPPYDSSFLNSPCIFLSILFFFFFNIVSSGVCERIWGLCVRPIRRCKVYSYVSIRLSYHLFILLLQYKYAKSVLWKKKILLILTNMLFPLFSPVWLYLI